VSPLPPLPFEAVNPTDVYAEQRGLEQILHETYQPPLNKGKVKGREEKKEKGTWIKSRQPSRIDPRPLFSSFMNGIGATHPTAELASEEDLAMFDDNEPPQILPIGYTFMGNLIFLVTHPEDRGWIGLTRAFSDQSFFLAEGIEEFFGLLHEPPAD
jgi:hypothetical protein